MKIKRIKGILLNIIIVCLLIIFSISAFKISEWFVDNNKTDKVIKKIEKKTKVVEKKDTPKTETINPPVQEELDEFNPYWDYMSMNLIDVDFTDLKNDNPDTVGWIKVNGTKINYPFVQTSDNSYYLKHSFDKSYNSSGWIFMDYRNNPTQFDKNTILYAHGRVNGTMFGSLKNTLSSDWLDNTDNYVVKLSTETENTLWQVFSIYHIPTTNDYIKTTFISDEDFLNFINLIKNRSMHDFNTLVDVNDKILTLSTCYNDEEKVVMHAKLIKREVK